MNCTKLSGENFVCINFWTYIDYQGFQLFKLELMY